MEREDLRKKLLDLIEEETWERPTAFEDGVQLREELELDSVDMLSVSLRAEEQLGISMGSGDFVGLETVGDLLNKIQAKLAAKGQSKAA